jgi:hypothetical protein
MIKEWGIFVEDPTNIICTKLQNILSCSFGVQKKKKKKKHLKTKYCSRGPCILHKMKCRISVEDITNIICDRCKQIEFVIQ